MLGYTSTRSDSDKVLQRCKFCKSVPIDLYHSIYHYVGHKFLLTLIFDAVYFRILMNEKKFSRQEIEEKMNLDETSCCPRRSKRKRRRLDVGSNSEEEEESLAKVLARTNGISSNYVKRKPLKKCGLTPPSNGIRREIQFRPPIPIRPRPASFLSGGQSFNAEPPKSATSLKNSIVNPKSIVVSTPSLMKSNTSLSSRFDSNALQQQQQQQPPTLYHTSFMNTSGSTAYIQAPVNSTTRIILPQSQSQLTSYRSQQASSYQPQHMGPYQPQQASSYQPQQTSSYQSQRANSYQSSQQLQSTPNTMVSIPNPMDKQGRALFLLPKSKELDVTLIPNIIELDSDSDDEPRVVAQQNDSTIDENNMDANNSANKVVPVALTWENNDDDFLREEQPFREICATVRKEVSFSEMMLSHSRELDSLLSDTKEKVYNLFNLNNAIENIEVETQQRMKRFYFNMRDTVFQLVHINDRIVRQYIEWKSSRKTETETSSSTNENALVSQKNVDIPLDMICVNDSDAESECENQIRKPSDLIEDNNILKDLFCKTNVVHRGVGDNSVHLSTDKAIQVYDTVSRDYEKCIGYSMVTKTDQDQKTDDSVSNLPATSDKNFGKYEEQFIFYLQHIEDNGIETESMKGVDSDEILLQEVQTSPLLTPHLLQNIDSSTDQTKNYQEKNLSDNINSVTKDDKNDTVDKNKEIINNSDTNNIEKTNMQLDDKLQQTELQKAQADKMDEKKTMSDNNEVNSNKNDNIINEVACTGNEEDCTIIDD